MAKVKAGMDGKQMRQMFIGKKASEGSESKKAVKAKAKPPMKNDNDADDAPKKPMIKPSRRGLLHKKLGVPQGKKIPAGKINKALNSKSPALRKEANFAKNFGK